MSRILTSQQSQFLHTLVIYQRSLQENLKIISKVAVEQYWIGKNESKILKFMFWKGRAKSRQAIYMQMFTEVCRHLRHFIEGGMKMIF